MKVDREKERLKDNVMYGFKNIEYLKIVDKKYDGFFKYLAEKKEANMLEDKKRKINTRNL